MFERYTDRARRVIVLAQDEARHIGHSTIDTGHLLLGLISEGESAAFTALADCGVTAEGAREAALSARPAGDRPAGGHLPFTPGMKKALELGFRESVHCGDTFVAPLHLLLGLIRDSDGPGTVALARCASLPAVQARALELAGGNRGNPAAASPAGETVSAALAAWLEHVGLTGKITEQQRDVLTRAFMQGFACGGLLG